jgi:hypothetical protein
MAYVWGEYSMLDDIIGNGMQDCMNGIFGGGLSFQGLIQAKINPDILLRQSGLISYANTTGNLHYGALSPQFPTRYLSGLPLCFMLFTLFFGGDLCHCLILHC